MSKGIVVVAQNNNSIDYVECARTLAKSIRKTNPNLPISLITDVVLEDNNFDSIIEFPHMDRSTVDNKFINDWQVYDASPYEETFKIESDVIITRSLNSWWDACSNRQLAIAHGCVNYKNNLNYARDYRILFEKNDLPDVYNGITYFKKGKIAEDFFVIVKTIFENWDDYKNVLRYCPDNEIATTDVVYALATIIHGEEKCLIPSAINPLKWVHMKPKIIDIVSDDWTKELFFEILHNGQVKICNYSQFYPVHYVHKSLATVLGNYYD